MAEEARLATGMERALSDSPRSSEEQALWYRTQRAHVAQRYQKAGSYTLAEKYNLLDIFPPTVTITETKPV